MRILTIMVILLGLGWSSYWVVGRIALTRGIDAAVAQAQTDGWQVTWEDLSVAGFPNRFDTSITDLTAQSPDGWGLEVPRLDILALSYRLNKIIMVPALPLSVTTLDGPLRVSGADLRASATLTLANPPLPSRAEAEGTALQLETSTGAAAIARSVAAMRQAATPNAYDLALTLNDLEIEGPGIAPPVTLDLVRFRATAQFDRPLAEQANLAALLLSAVELVWAGGRLNLTGEIKIGPSGLPEGELTLDVVDWQALPSILTALGLLEGQVMMLVGGISGIAEDGRAQLSLTLSQGVLRFGGLPLTPLPRLPIPYRP